MFDTSRRISLIKAACIEAGIGSNIEVDSFEGLLVDYARQNNIDAIIRGIRVLSDFDAEFRMGLANRDLAGVETLFLLTDPDHIFVSSSMIKEIASCSSEPAFDGNVGRYVPHHVLSALRGVYFP